MRWRPNPSGRAISRALGVAIGSPVALIALRWHARGWGVEEPGEGAAPPPERWAKLRLLAERASLMRSSRVDIEGIRRWHAEHGFSGSVVLCCRERRECFYIYNEPSVQQVFVRGTCVLEDLIHNVLVAKDWDRELGCHLHHGFRRRADQVLGSLEPLLERTSEITLSGHSLGGAVATIVGMRLQARGYRVREVVTFGAPKITDRAGARHQPFGARVLRVSNLLDPVPLLPFGFCTPFSGPFVQLGSEVLLLPPRPGGGGSAGPSEPQPAFVYLDHEAAAVPWVTSFLLHVQPQAIHGPGSRGWLDMHRMWSYSRLLEPFAVAPESAQRLPFQRRHVRSMCGTGGLAGAATALPFSA